MGMLFKAQGLLATGHCYRGCFCDSFVINVPVLNEDTSDDTTDSFYEELWYIKRKGKSHPTTCREGIGGVGGQHHSPATSGNSPGTQCTRHSVGLGGLNSVPSSP